MTLQVDPGCGDASYTSTIYEVEVSGQATHCYGYEDTTEFDVTGFWPALATLQVSCARFGTDASVVVRVTRLVDGPIDSFRVYPRRIFDDRSELQDGEVVISMPPHSKCCVTTNGVRKERLYICADDLAEAEPVGGVVYNGTQASVPDGTALIFPAGVTDLEGAGAWADKLFPVEGDATVYFRRGSWVIGSFDIRTSPTTLATGVRFIGPGNLSGEWITNAAVQALPTFEEQHEHALIFGFIAGNYGGDCEVRDITLWRAPGFNIAGAIHRAYDVGVLSPWNDFVAGFEMLGDPEDGDVTRIEDCFAWTGDDTLIADWFTKNVVARNNILSTSASHVILCGYTQPFDFAFTDYTRTFTNNTVLACNEYYLDEELDREGGSVVQGWIDAPLGERNRGIFNVTVDGLYVDGDLMTARLFDIGNRSYPWGAPLDQHGQVSGIVLRNIVVESTPTESSYFRGFDHQNVTNGVQIENVSTGGTRWSTRNAAAFLTVDPGAFNLTIDGASLVT